MNYDMINTYILLLAALLKESSHMDSSDFTLQI